jgi:hypothetical protein
MGKIDPQSERSLILIRRPFADRLSRLRPLALLVAAGTVVASCGAAPTIDPAGEAGPVDSAPSVDATSPAAVEPPNSIQITVVPESTTPIDGATSQRWVVDKLHLGISVPVGSRLDPHLVPLSQIDVKNGLLLLQRWIVSSCSCVLALSVQKDPGDDAPVNKEIVPYAVILVDSTEWRLVDFGSGDRSNTVAFARIDAYLVEVTGNEQLVRSIVKSIETGLEGA